MELEKLILSEDEVLEFVDLKSRQDITNTNINLNKKIDDYTKAISSDFSTLNTDTTNTVRYLTSIITNHQNTTTKELQDIKEDLLNSIPKNLSDLVDDKGFLTHLPEELITEIELALALDNKGFIKLEEVTDKINILRNELTSYSNEKTQQHILDTDNKLTTLEQYLLQYINNKSSDITSYVDNLVSSSVKDIIPEDLIDAKIEAASTGHASEAYVDSKVRDATADKATISYVDARVQSYVEDKVTIAEVNKKVNDAVANKATTSYVDTEVANAVKDKATVSYVDTKISTLINSAPATLDTLGEIAEALKSNSNIINTLNAAIGNKADKTAMDTALSSKADKSDLDTLREELNSGVSDAVIEEINSALELKADKTAIPTTVASLADAGEYVKFNNIATANGDYGLVKIGTGGTGITVNKNGYLQLTSATDTEIQDESETSYRCLQPRHVSKIVKQGLINNTLTWSETEKQAALDLLGALKKTTTTTTNSQLYMKNPDGTNTMIDIAPVGGNYVASGIPRYSAGGCIAVGNPTYGPAAANKQYVDNLINTTVKQVEYSKTQTFADGSDAGVIGRLYMRFRDNTENSIVINCQNAKYTIPCRDSTGNFYVGNPTQLYHTTNKKYVDEAIANIKPFTVEELEDGSYSITLMEV